MQIILLHPRFNARTLTLGRWHLLLLAFLFIASVTAAASLLYWLSWRYAVNLPLVHGVAAEDEAARKEKYVRENLAAMAVRVGEMQAQMMRLDALGERVQGLAGIKPQEFNFKELPGRGGTEPSSMASQPLSMNEFQRLLDMMARDVERRADYMNVIETTLMSQKIKTKLLPTIQPVNVSYNASGFGARIDPFSGRSAFHEGIDFAAPVGTPIVAAAGGVVIAAEFHHQFGNMLEIDHGNNIITRYAHALRLHAKVGDIVKRGQHVADIGTTGRSTGPHLHFEVLVKGVPQDPHKFLAAGGNQARLSALASK